METPAHLTNKETLVSFRNLISDFPSTIFGTFSIYGYPAKFIPQVVAYVLKEYGKPGMKIFDPFAGYGTVGIVSRIFGYDYELWDLNPILKLTHAVGTMKPINIKIEDLIEEMKKSEREFTPKWSNLNYWFPEKFLPLLKKSWGFLNNLTDKEIKKFLTIPLLKATKYFSSADEKIFKTYKSPRSKEKIRYLENSNWEEKFYSILSQESLSLLQKLKEYQSLNPKNIKSVVKSGFDTLTTTLNEPADILITSPPYLQAQEYIRSSKIELPWLGFDEEEIKNLSKKEIPYNKPKEISICSKTYQKYREKIKEEHLLKLYDAYFYSILNAFVSLRHKINYYMCIFVGPAKIRNVPIPIDQIIVEHLIGEGWKHRCTLIDKIKSRSLFGVKINPASGLKEKRIQTEHLVILEK